MFKIGEFSKLTQVSIRMLRYYDEMGLLKPSQVDQWSGYRLYSVEQIPVLNKIIYLRDSGFNVSEIAIALNNNKEDFVASMLDMKYAQIEKNIQDEKEKLEKVKLAKKELLKGKSEMHYNILIKNIPSYHVLSMRKIIPTYYSEGEMWNELSEFVLKNKVEIEANTFSVYHDSEYKEQDVDVELCVPVKNFGKNDGIFVYRDIEPVPIMACSMVYGDFSNIAGAYSSFAEWLQKNSRYEMTGQNRQIVHRGPWNEDNPQNYLTEIQIPLKEG